MHRKLSTTDDIIHDLISIVSNIIFLKEITPYLNNLSKISHKIKDVWKKNKIYYAYKRPGKTQYNINTQGVQYKEVS